MRKVILNCRTENLEDFRKLCVFAKETGITHVVISHIEKSIWQWNRNRKDPYPNWGMYNASIFKIVVPEALKAYLPVDYAERNLETVRQRGAILKEYGLKGVFEGMEPAWLPEEVYRDHPAWRGPRCDQPRRARTEYFAPCTDNPEVAALYLEAVQKLCEIVPIEFFRFLTNDSGGGLCWCEGLYPGSNGPESCRHISVPQRAVNFLSIIQEAAAKAGVTAEAGYQRQFRVNEMAAIKVMLKDGQFAQGETNKDSILTKDIGYQEHQDPTFPIMGIPLIGFIADQMMDTAEDEISNIYYRIPDVSQTVYFEFIRQSLGTLKKSVVSKHEVLKRTAEALIGEKYAERLVDIWDSIDRAQDRMRFLNQGGHLMQLGTVHQRWLTRPLVPFPQELTDEEKAHYREYLFQAETEKEANNLTNMQGSIWVGGDVGYLMIEKVTLRAFEAVNRAVAIIDELLGKEDIGAYAEELYDLKLRLKMFNCEMNNAKNVVQFQSILDRTDYENPPVDTTIAKEEQGDKRLYKMTAIMRKEIDNTLQMISLLDEVKSPMFRCTETEENEDIMHFGPDIRNDLLKKVEIMENHRYDLNRLYKSYNI